MDDEKWLEVRPDTVLEFWFPDDSHYETMATHEQFWTWRMRGGADEDICRNFSELTKAAAMGQLDHWAGTPQGRLALIIALDQFPRSIWRDTPGAYAQDIKATRLAMEGIDNGHFDALGQVWEKQFYLIAISHCEGPDHLERMDRLLEIVETLVPQAPAQLQSFYALGIEHNEIVRDIIFRYGRHPHRNNTLGRISTTQENAYLETGDFPHQRPFPDDTDNEEPNLNV
jgi:uncharacterized protein (DUF924 family)